MINETEDDFDNDSPAGDEARPGDNLDELLDEPQEAREWFRRKAQTEGLKATYYAMLDVLNDKRAPSPARATAGGLMLRAAGVFSKKFEAESDAEGKSIDLLTPEEMQRELRRLQGRRRALQRMPAKPSDRGSDASGGKASSPAGVFE